jgi:putative SOS response-associated peptidase YedK
LGQRFKISRKTYNAETKTVHKKTSFRHVWKNNQFALILMDTIYEPKYIDGKAHWYGIYGKDGMPFTVAMFYEHVLNKIQK